MLVATGLVLKPTASTGDATAMIVRTEATKRTVRQNDPGIMYGSRARGIFISDQLPRDPKAFASFAYTHRLARVFAPYLTLVKSEIRLPQGGRGLPLVSGANGKIRSPTR